VELSTRYTTADIVLETDRQYECDRVFDRAGDRVTTSPMTSMMTRCSTLPLQSSGHFELSCDEDATAAAADGEIRSSAARDQSIVLSTQQACNTGTEIPSRPIL